MPIDTKAAGPASTEGQGERDRLLMARARSGDRKALELLYAHYREGVYWTAFRVCRDSEDAVDVAQEAFLKVFRQILYSDTKIGSFRDYIYQSARNASYKVLERRRRATPSQQLDLDDGPVEPIEAGEDPERSLLIGDTREMVKSASKELSETHYRALYLFELEGKSYTDVAYELGVTSNTAAQYIFRARQGLKKEIRKNAVVLPPSTFICNKMMAMMPEYLDSGLSGRERGWFEPHLQECDVCKTNIAAMEEIGVSYRGVTPPATLAFSFLAKGLKPGMSFHIGKVIVTRKLVAAALVALGTAVTGVAVYEVVKETGPSGKNTNESSLQKGEGAGPAGGKTSVADGLKGGVKGGGAGKHVGDVSQPQPSAALLPGEGTAQAQAPASSASPVPGSTESNKGGGKSDSRPDGGNDEGRSFGVNFDGSSDIEKSGGISFDMDTVAFWPDLPPKYSLQAPMSGRITNVTSGVFGIGNTGRMKILVLRPTGKDADGYQVSVIDESKLFDVDTTKPGDKSRNIINNYSVSLNIEKGDFLGIQITKGARLIGTVKGSPRTDQYNTVSVPAAVDKPTKGTTLQLKKNPSAVRMFGLKATFEKSKKAAVSKASLTGRSKSHQASYKPKVSKTKTEKATTKKWAHGGVESVKPSSEADTNEPVETEPPA